MKNLFGMVMLVILAFTGFDASAQLVPEALTATNGDTLITNTTVAKQTVTVKEDGYVIITATVTKRSGTLAGKLELMGTNDGVTYKRIKGCGLTTTVDTLVLADNSTAQTYSWKIDPTCYWKYRPQVTGVGTMTASLRCWAWRRKHTCN